MSYLDGERAFDLITDRMLDLNTRLDAVSRERDEARGVRYDLDRQVKSLGEFVKSERGRTAFKIVEIVMPKKPGTKHVCRFRCERHFALQNTDVVHAWQWSKR